ncbi:pilus assembly protein TadG-related protein [Mesorhizobium sp. MSK_1335]|uniref:Pilus assembly protein TadG-related protein n=1 Tax=Mesorhizobium montanum TaxID=3072323 RepID=A0ABU4ZNS2_9HYPH|nr:pilus assembly protein TadG-related protein [Mesorhizobium sp. MSK_1335]MDX8527026.1 pilus assembly protein TadG-related protein [Mesorhizobium sp. MSK_1335]
MRRLEELLRNKCGNFAVAAALMAVPLGLALGLSIDLTNTFFSRSRLQEIADAAALVGVESEAGNEEAVQAAKDWAIANSGSWTDIVVDADITKPDNGQREAVVKISARMPTFFVSLAGIQTIDLHAKATARKTAPDYCLYALDPNSSGALTVTGSGGVSAPDCGIQVNSSSERALKHVGNGRITASKISVVGAYQGGGFSVTPKTNQPQLVDPLADTPEPVLPSGCAYNNEVLADIQIPAGRTFCGSISFDGDVTLSPGIHYLHNAVVSIGSNAGLSGDGVTIFLDRGSSIIQSPGNGSVRLSAPTDGIYSGIAIFGSRRASDAVATLSFIGNKNYLVNGAIYLPHHRLRMKGTHDLKAIVKSGWVVAWQILYSGDSTVSIGADGAFSAKGLQNPEVVLLR